jgi:hypothetical protein
MAIKDSRQGLTPMDSRLRDEQDPHKIKVPRFLLIGALVAVTINSLPYIISFDRYLSHMTAYRAVHLGMPRSDAIAILRENNLDCGSVYPPASLPRSCQFWDFWRAYTVSFGPGSDGYVELKYYSYRLRQRSLMRAVSWIRHVL